MQDAINAARINLTDLKDLASISDQPLSLQNAADLVMEVRNSAGLSIEQLARVLDVKASEIEKWEKAEKMPAGPELAVLQLARLDSQALYDRARTQIQGIIDA